MESPPTTTGSLPNSDKAPRQPDEPVIGCSPGDGSYLLAVGRRNSRARPGTRIAGSVNRVASVGAARHRLGGEDSGYEAAAAALVVSIHRDCSARQRFALRKPTLVAGASLRRGARINRPHPWQPLRRYCECGVRRRHFIGEILLSRPLPRNRDHQSRRAAQPSVHVQLPGS